MPGDHPSRRPFPLRAQALLERDARLPAELGADSRRVGVRAALVARHRSDAAHVEDPAEIRSSSAIVSFIDASSAPPML